MALSACHCAERATNGADFVVALTNHIAGDHAGGNERLFILGSDPDTVIEQQSGGGIGIDITAVGDFDNEFCPKLFFVRIRTPEPAIIGDRVPRRTTFFQFFFIRQLDIWAFINYNIT